MAELDWLFTPTPKSEEHLHVEPLQASTEFYLRFTLFRSSSLGFRSNPRDLWHFHTIPLVNCGVLLSLWIPFYRLSLPRRRTPWHVIQNARQNSEEP